MKTTDSKPRRDRAKPKDPTPIGGWATYSQISDHDLNDFVELTACDDGKAADLNKALEQALNRYHTNMALDKVLSPSTIGANLKECESKVGALAESLKLIAGNTLETQFLAANLLAGYEWADKFKNQVSSFSSALVKHIKDVESFRRNAKRVSKGVKLKEARRGRTNIAGHTLIRDLGGIFTAYVDSEDISSALIENRNAFINLGLKVVGIKAKTGDYLKNFFHGLSNADRDI